MDISNLTATELDELISKAAEKRAEMMPHISYDPPKDGTFTFNPGWYVDLVDTGSLVQIRSPGVGWVSVVIPPIDRARIASVLTMHCLMSAATNTGSAATTRTPTITGSGGGGVLH